MAKSLEEHLYRSATTKEEYMDQNTLRNRLQKIAQGLESHQSNNGGEMNQNQNNAMPHSDTQQLADILQGGELGTSGGNSNSNLLGGGAGNQFDQQGMNDMIDLGGGGMNASGNNISSNDITMDQRRKSAAQAQIENIARANLQGGVGGMNNMQLQQGNHAAGAGGDPARVIRQQQQRLLLLRHASKCKLGAACTTKFCAQMKPLWQHMKRCRDKDCTTRHCQSSRCVLTHYRICKSQGKTATCEICGPVMEHIQKIEANEGLDSSNDPLTEKMDGADFSAHVDLRNVSGFGSELVENTQAAQQQLAREQALRLQQQHLKANPMGGMHMPLAPPLGLNVGGDASTMLLQQQNSNNPQLLIQQLQQLQVKFQQKQLVLQN